MARNMQPILKRCKTLGISPAAMGVNKNSIRNPKQGRRKQSEYAMQLNEKQKAKFIYGVQERQFRHYYEMATKTSGVTGENLLRLLERRLDNCVYRLGFANTRREARQMVNHGHITVNGKKVDICSYLISEGDLISIAEKSRSSQHVKDILEKNAATVVPKWLTVNHDAVEGKVVAMPERSDIDFDINETLIVELYSK
ncbi:MULTISPECIES: 30S ribosomal protein S4 [Caproicibacterium]|uniref:Small ribosomal subunit protein uS4 n=1 Tax=Caproicibacterium argilliputei TaxID=3030016 RepID=A0AA97H1K7_9FIRM|nr:30S ribosomal protein S4 [Caproicibacterium argilliputei]WOC32611.1 30S ribosomal protein S4 [Caproicibacterium argilliputei]